MAGSGKIRSGLRSRRIVETRPRLGAVVPLYLAGLCDVDTPVWAAQALVMGPHRRPDPPSIAL